MVVVRQNVLRCRRADSLTPRQVHECILGRGDAARYKKKQESRVHGDVRGREDELAWEGEHFNKPISEALAFGRTLIMTICMATVVAEDRTKYL